MSSRNHQKVVLLLAGFLLLVAPSNSFSSSLPTPTSTSRGLSILQPKSRRSTVTCDMQKFPCNDADQSPSSRRHIISRILAAGLMAGSVFDDVKPAIAATEDDAISTDAISTDAIPGTDAISTDAVTVDPPFTVAMTIELDKGTEEIEIRVEPSWAPLAAARFRKLVEIGFYDDARFFRVMPGYIAQFGIASDPALNKEWLYCGTESEQKRGIRCRALADEPRVQPNKRGTLSFASAGANSRQTQVFINLNNNGGVPNFLDAQGFVPFARVTKGMDSVVSQINSEYGLMETVSGGLAGSVNQGKAAYYGKEYLDALFPKLSNIKSARIL